ncbi:MAG: pitrilysin family protein [Candidatus Eisenbacteria bacterium]
MNAAKHMPRVVLALALVLTSMAAVAHAVDKSIYDPRRIVTPPIGRIPAVKPLRYTLPNGIVVFLLEDHDLPSVSGVAYFPSSPSLVPTDKVGLAGITGQVMRSGGSKAHGGDYLDDHLAAIGAALSSSVAAEQGTGGFRCLTENTAEVIGLWSELLRAPAFPAEKLELAKVSARQGIASRNDEMIGILMRAASQAVYTKDSPWARQPEYATIEAIAPADLESLHEKVFVPERAVFAIYGDFKSADMKKLLTARFGDWTKSGTPTPVLPPVPTSVKPKLFYAPKLDVTQSGIIVAQIGSKANDPDYAAMQVLEQGLGGGFSSRMFNRIRTQRGLAYGTGANAGTDFRRPGVFLAYSLTKSESTMVALDIVREEVRKVTEAPFTPAEIAVAKDAVVNSFVFNFEDPSQTLFRAASYEAMGYPQDFLQTYQKALDGVTAQSVLDAAKRKITPDAQVVILVGKEADFDRRIETAGLPVERLDITIPPPPSKNAGVVASPEGKQKGHALLVAAANAVGGAAEWDKVKAVSTAAEATISIQGQNLGVTMEEHWVLPNKQLSKQKLPFGEVSQGFDGKSGWQSAMGQLQDDPKAGEEIAKDYEKSLWRLFSDASLELVALDKPESIAGVEYAAALVRGAKTQDLTLLFDKGGRLAGLAYQDTGSGQMGPARVTQLYSDWQPEGAIRYPRAMKMLRDGKPFIEAKLTSLKLNPVLADAMFQKPTAAPGK